MIWRADAIFCQTRVHASEPIIELRRRQATELQQAIHDSHTAGVLHAFGVDRPALSAFGREALPTCWIFRNDARVGRLWRLKSQRFGVDASVHQ
jgi:hypothetical protein